MRGNDNVVLVTRGPPVSNQAPFSGQTLWIIIGAPWHKLPEVIDMAIEAVSAGELDKALKAAPGERRVKLRRVGYIHPETAG